MFKIDGLLFPATGEEEDEAYSLDKAREKIKEVYHIISQEHVYQRALQCLCSMRYIPEDKRFISVA